MKNNIFLLVLWLGMCCGQTALRAEAPSAAVRICERQPGCAELALRAHNFSRANLLAEALTAYQTAARLSADPRLLFNIARVLHRMGRLAEASGYYRRYLDAGAEGSPGQRTKTEEYLAEAQLGPPGAPTLASLKKPSFDPTALAGANPAAVTATGPAGPATASPPQTHALTVDAQPPGDEPGEPGISHAATLRTLPSKDCSSSSRAHKLKIGGWTLLGVGGAFVAAAIVPTVLSTLSGACKHADGTPAQLCSSPPAPAPNFWPLAATGYGLGALSIGGGIGLLAWSQKTGRRETTRGEAACPR